MQLVSLFPRITETVPVANRPIDAVVQSIINPPRTRVVSVERVKAATSQEARRQLKAELLPYVTWSGTFHKRRATGMDVPSGYVYIDVDPLPTDKSALDRRENDPRAQMWAQEIRNALRGDASKWMAALAAQPWCAGAWCSASGMGIGVLVPTHGVDHATAWANAVAAAQSVLRDGNHSAEVDASTKDVSRPNYLSYDPNAHWNPDAVPPPPAPAPKRSIATPIKRDRATETELARGAVDAIEQGLLPDYPAGEHTREAWLTMTFSVNAYAGDAARNAWYRHSRRCGRLPDGAVGDREFDRVWGCGNGSVTGGTFVMAVRDEAQRRGVDDPLTFNGEFSDAPNLTLQAA